MKKLSIIKEEIPELKIFEIPSGTEVFDWTVPKEWKVRDAYIITPDKFVISNNLHLIGYSSPINIKFLFLNYKNTSKYLSYTLHYIHEKDGVLHSS